MEDARTNGVWKRLPPTVRALVHIAMIFSAGFGVAAVAQSYRGLPTRVTNLDTRLTALEVVVHELKATTEQREPLVERFLKVEESVKVLVCEPRVARGEFRSQRECWDILIGRAP